MNGNLCRWLVMGTFAAALAVAASAAERDEAQEALLARIVIAQDAMDFDADRACLRNEGDAGTWTGAPYTLAFAVLTERAGAARDGEVKVVAPDGLDARVELQPKALVLRVSPASGLFDVAKGELLCFDLVGFDVTPGDALAVGRGAPSGQ